MLERVCHLRLFSGTPPASPSAPRLMRPLPGSQPASPIETSSRSANMYVFLSSTRVI